MSFDRPTGDLWVGDVGWELWEMIYRVKPGGNYGWSVMEGPQAVRPDGKRGPTPISPPNLAFPHTEAASITGGYVYRGKRLKDLAGTYICGDWVTRKLWGTRFDGDKIVSHQELAQGNQRVVAFGLDQDQELYFLHHDEAGTIHQLVPNEAVKDYRADFPRKLSETGLFSSAKDHVPAPGVMPFSINAEQWADHAVAERFVALPGTTTARMYDRFVPIPGGFFSGQVFFPKDSVLAKTLSLEMVAGNPQQPPPAGNPDPAFRRHRLERLQLRLERRADRRRPGAVGGHGPRHHGRGRERPRRPAPADLAFPQPGAVHHLS